MGAIVLDLYGDPHRPATARAHGAQSVLLAKTDFRLAKPSDAAVVVDARTRYEQGLEAGTTRVVFLGDIENGHGRRLADIASAIGRR